MTITTLADLTSIVFPSVLYQEADGLLHDERSKWTVATWTLAPGERRVYVRDVDQSQESIQWCPDLVCWALADSQ